MKNIGLAFKFLSNNKIFSLLMVLIVFICTNVLMISFNNIVADKNIREVDNFLEFNQVSEKVEESEREVYFNLIQKGVSFSFLTKEDNYLVNYLINYPIDEIKYYSVNSEIDLFKGQKVEKLNQDLDGINQEARIVKNFNSNNKTEFLNMDNQFFNQFIFKLSYANLSPETIDNLINNPQIKSVDFYQRTKNNHNNLNFNLYLLISTISSFIISMISLTVIINYLNYRNKKIKDLYVESGSKLVDLLMIDVIYFLTIYLISCLFFVLISTFKLNTLLYLILSFVLIVILIIYNLINNYQLYFRVKC